MLTSMIASVISGSSASSGPMYNSMSRWSLITRKKCAFGSEKAQIPLHEDFGGEIAKEPAI